MNVLEMLDELEGRAWKDEKLGKRLLHTRKEQEPLKAFCAIARELGFPIYEMDVICAGEEFYASMKRSTNGGGENSPVLEGENDYYELLMASLENEDRK